METISVIVPVYNVERYLPRCLDSLLAQTYPHLEIILVDDGTKDRGGIICDEYAARDSRIRVIHKENGGLSSARNAGIDRATGEYIAFLDSDDWLEEDAYEYMLGLIKTYDVKLCCAGRYDVEDATGKRTLGLCPPREEKITTEELAGRIFTWDNIDSAAWDKLYHRSLFAHYRYPLGKICEDVPVTYKIILQTDYAVMGNKPIYNYRHRSGSITTAAVSDKIFHFPQHTQQLYPYVRKHYPSLEPQARYLRIKSLMYVLLTMESRGERSWERFPEEYAQAKKDLRQHLGFIQKTQLLSSREKLSCLLLCTGLYRPVRQLRKKRK